MGSGEFLALLPLFIASLVPACLLIAAFLVKRQVQVPLPVASFVTVLTLALTYIAVFLRPLLSLIGFDAREMAPDSVMHDVVQLDIVSGCMFVLVSTLALIVVRYSRSYLAGQQGLDRYARYLLLTV